MKSKWNPNLIGLGCLMLALNACAPAAPNLQSFPKGDPGGSTLSAPVSTQANFARKVDILFVIDTSESMTKHQENLKLNIDRFVESFKRHVDVDFHIGIVSVWDSIRYNKAVKEPYEIGKLRPLKDPQKGSQPALSGVQYVTRDEPRFAEILGESLKVGIENRYMYTTDKHGKKIFAREPDGRLIDGGGPEFEETFSPILPALSGKNDGFYRKDAHLAVVMITDADDATQDLTPDLLARQLVELKGGNHKMVSGYAALAVNGCRTDPGSEVRDENGKVLRVNPPVNILDFVQLTGGSYMNLCDERFGDKLGVIGRSIQEKANAQMHIQLKKRPDISTLKVTYVVKGQILELVPGEGYSYIEDQNEILIHGDYPVIASAPGGEIKIDFTPINWAKYKQGHVKHAGH